MRSAYSDIAPVRHQGTLLIEPKPQAPTQHPHDHDDDAATVCGVLRRHGLACHVKAKSDRLLVSRFV